MNTSQKPGHGLNRRQFIAGLSVTLAAAGTGVAALSPLINAEKVPSVEELLQQHYKQLTKNDKQQIFQRLEHENDAAVKQFRKALVKEASCVLAPLLNGTFSVISYPAGFNYTIQYGPNSYYNTATLHTIDRLASVGEDGIVTLQNYYFSNLYQKILQNTVYKFSTSDQAKLNALMLKHKLKKQALIISYEENVEQISDQMIKNSGCFPAKKIGYIKNVIDTRYSGNPDNLPNTLAGFSSAYKSFLSLGAQLNTFNSRQTTAISEITGAVNNTISPTAENSGLQTGPLSYYPGYDGMPGVEEIRSSLKNDKNQMTVSCKFSKASALNYKRGTDVPDVSSFNISNPQVDDDAKIGLSLQREPAGTLDMQVTYTGITIVTPKPMPLTANQKKGWYSNNILSQVIEKTNKDETGFQLQNSEFSVARLFGIGKTFARVRAFVISNEPTIKLTFRNADEYSIRAAFKENDNITLDLAEMFSFGSVSDGLIIKEIKSSHTTDVIVTLSPDTIFQTLSTPQQATAFIIGGVIEYPPPNISPSGPVQIPLTSNSPFSLKSEDGRYIGAAKFGDSIILRAKSGGERSYWPMLKGDAVTFQIQNQQQLESGDVVKINTDEKFRVEWQDCNIIGAFAGGVYYWNDYGSKSNWRIEKIIDSSDTQIYVGDSIRLWNESYRQYLAPGDNDYLTTKDKPYAWTIKKS